MDKLLIISDFDGTISQQDVNDYIFSNFGNKKSEKIEELYQSGKIGLKEALIRHYSHIKINKRSFTKLIKEKINLDPYFFDFYKEVRDSDIKFIIVSGGFINYIKILFSQNKINFNDNIYANKLIFNDDKIKLNFFHNINECEKEFNLCGNCKYKIIKNYKLKGYKIIYIGDGLTDRCAADEVDYLFVKNNSSLENYCNNYDFNFISFENFNDLIKIVRLIKEDKKYDLSGS